MVSNNAGFEGLGHEPQLLLTKFMMLICIFSFRRNTCGTQGTRRYNNGFFDGLIATWLLLRILELQVSEHSCFSSIFSFNWTSEISLRI